MVSGVASSLRGILGIKTTQELTQADIKSILEKTRGELKEIWIEIGILGTDAPQTEEVLTDIRNLRTQYRSFAYYCTEMEESNNKLTLKSDLSILKANQTSARKLHNNVATLRKDVVNTTRKVHVLSSRLEVGLVEDTEMLSEPTSHNSDAEGVSKLFRFVKHAYARSKKQSQKDSNSPGLTSQRSPSASDASSSSSSSQTALNSSAIERPVAQREETTYCVRLGYRTSAEEVIFTGENQTDIQIPGWVGPTLREIPRGHLVESQVQPVLERARQMSVGNALEPSEHFGAVDDVMPVD